MKNKFLINLHAHTVFSDGSNSPYVMAWRAKELGFTALVITDHWYGRTEKSLTRERFETLRRATHEAREIIPVIIGLEVPIGGQEILVFGGAAVKNIVNAPSLPTYDNLWNLKCNTHCAFILCHPRGDIGGRLVGLIDGFEAYNSGRCWFKTRGFGNLHHLPAWSNADAHSAKELQQGYNGTDCKITNETELIKYIKLGEQPDLYVRGEKQ